MDLSDIKQYLIEIPDDKLRMIDKRVLVFGIEDYCTRQLMYLDCSRTYPSGLRAMQTIGYPYKYEISCYIHALETQVNELTCDHLETFNKQEWIDKLIERHKENLKYEEDNPPIVYEKKTKSRTKWVSSRKVQNKEVTPKEKQPSRKAIKAANKVAKLNMLSLKIVK